MTQEQEPIKIIIPVEEETPLVPERTGPDVKGTVTRAGKTAVKTTVGAVKKAWQSEPRRKVTGSVMRGAAAVASKSGRFVGDKVAQAAEKQARERVMAVQTRLKETDWKQEAKRSTAGGLRWLSQKLARLAQKFASGEEKAASGG